MGKVYFRLEEGLYLLVFTVAWEEFCGGFFLFVLCFFSDSILKINSKANRLLGIFIWF